MNKPTIICRCGHHVVGRELLRTEPYERANGEEAIYVKYRCRRCKMGGEAFVPRAQWDPHILETPRDEMTYSERDRIIEEKAISSSDVISFHRALQKMATLDDLSRPETRRKEKKNEKTRPGDKSKDGQRDGDKPSQAGKSGS